MKKEQNFGRIIPFIQSDRLFFERGVSAYHRNELERADKYITRAIQINPEQGIYQCQLAVIYAEKMDYEKATDLLKYVLREVDDTIYEAHFFLANNYAYQGLFHKAKEEATRYLQLVPDGDFSADAEDLLDLLALEEDENDLRDDDELIIRYEEAVKLFKKKHYEEAELLFQNIIQEYPTYWAAQSQYAAMLFLKGEKEKATTYTKELIKNSQYLPAVFQLALFYKQSGRERDSQELVSALKQTLPLNKQHLFYAACTMCRLEEYELGYQFFRRYVSRFQSADQDLCFYKGAAAFLTNRFRQAEKWWKRAERMNHPQASALLEKCRAHQLTVSDVKAELERDCSNSLL
ncbi:tetratricopeptide repeat protein [Bacillus piscicola]|uniref:tetratricopeptide repeat protein n=1 Tax=Bacillus piscicola TaxID=1632684 RepID=UPI001F09043D|nr:hypothetical protein [Bacillus piscicola]